MGFCLNNFKRTLKNVNKNLLILCSSGKSINFIKHFFNDLAVLAPSFILIPKNIFRRKTVFYFCNNKYIFENFRKKKICINVMPNLKDY